MSDTQAHTRVRIKGDNEVYVEETCGQIADQLADMDDQDQGFIHLTQVDFRGIAPVFVDYVGAESFTMIAVSEIIRFQKVS